MNHELFERDRILEAFEAEEGRWLDRIRAVAKHISREEGRPVSADDVRAAIDKHPKLAPDRPSMNVMGAVFRKGFRRVGWKYSETEKSHGNRIGTYLPNHGGPS